MIYATYVADNLKSRRFLASLTCVSVPEAAPQNFTAIGVSVHSVRMQWDPPPRRLRNGDIVLYEVGLPVMLTL